LFSGEILGWNWGHGWVPMGVNRPRRHTHSSQRKLDPRRLVFIDETAISTSMTRRRGRMACGERLVCGAWQSVTMVAALRHNRMTAPMTLNGAMTGDSFRSYITQVLGPTLRRGDIVVPLHRTQAVRETLRTDGWRSLPSLSVQGVPERRRLRH
jgi:hypothetical protein